MTHSPPWLYPLTAPLSAVYHGIVRVRNRWYDNGGHVNVAPVPVVSIGGITAGGAAKTPLAIWTLEQLIALGKCPGLLSRGYGGGSGGRWVSRGDGSALLPAAQAGDEPRMIAERLREVPVYCDANRTRGAKVLAAHGVDCIVLDDGFQHRRLGRALDWVSLDTGLPRQAYRMLPLGYLREPFYSVARAQALWLKLDSEKGAEQWLVALQQLGIELPVVPFKLVETGWKCNGLARPLEFMRKQNAVGFAGIAHPDRFRRSLERSGVAVRGFCGFSDHQKYGKRDYKELLTLRRMADAEWFACTEKDYVKLDADFRMEPLAVLKVDVEVLGDASAVVKQLAEMVG